MKKSNRDYIKIDCQKYLDKCLSEWQLLQTRDNRLLHRWKSANLERTKNYCYDII